MSALKLDQPLYKLFEPGLHSQRPIIVDSEALESPDTVTLRYEEEAAVRANGGGGDLRGGSSPDLLPMAAYKPHPPQMHGFSDPSYNQYSSQNLPQAHLHQQTENAAAQMNQMAYAANNAAVAANNRIPYNFALAPSGFSAQGSQPNAGPGGTKIHLRISGQYDILSVTSTTPPFVSHHKAILHIQGNLESMTVGWTPEEWESRRRIVMFKKSQSGSRLTATFRAVPVNERPPNSICVSCIWWEEKHECYVTSVDTIHLLEQLVVSPNRFTVEEKNRIRRNLEGFKPLTVSKAKAESEDFFKIIMGFGNPKPRNIEKDVKVFPWKVLAPALKKIIGKYSASPSSTVPHSSHSHHTHLLTPCFFEQPLSPDGQHSIATVPQRGYTIFMGLIYRLRARRESELLSDRAFEDVIASIELEPAPERTANSLRHKESADGVVTLESLQPAVAE
ncbi:hypothetical protein N8I77_001744 [Diaporthe amygdali]|uniref:DUF7082 domain-containing protein n=1 Tax=Phomopsis amygdali TaxID=1214568 RepID=A0AAD9W8F4_PHOAM|nr:hypothetical protein N8I77_001744 [Diaporthe amygdali]KAK2614958.1 hypothetical protein N8I77_001744 [Diaporthe amygdali]KAK2614959.1 hypothetical protein N8I77_001744 [Diaporthe amygdali]